MIVSSGADRSWTATSLWSCIQEKNDPDSEAVRLTLQRRMPTIETVLSKGGTAPLDFTLHDAEHSFRVPEWMGSASLARG